MEYSKFFGAYEINVDSKIIYGYVEENEYQQLRKFFKISGLKWSVRTSHKVTKDWIVFNYVKSGIKIPFFGYPFVLKKNISLECARGNLYYSLKETHKNNQINEEKRTKTRKTKKINCPGRMKVVQIDYYPEYYLTGEFVHPHSKQLALQKLKNDIARGKQIDIRKRYYVNLSLPSAHNHHIEPICETPSNKNSAPDVDDDYSVTSLYSLSSNDIASNANVVIVDEVNISALRDEYLESIREINMKMINLTHLKPNNDLATIKKLDSILVTLQEQQNLLCEVIPIDQETV